MNKNTSNIHNHNSPTDSQHRIEKREGMVIEWDAPIEMDDGLILRANVYRPDLEGVFPVIMSHGPYGKDLAWQEGYKTTWDIFSKAHPEAIENSTNNEIKLAILKKAAFLEKNKIDKMVKERRKKIPRGSEEISPN